MIQTFKIGVVEDEPWTGTFIQGVLEDLGQEVLFMSRSAAETRTAMKVTPVELIFMDINIAGPEDGIRLAKSLQNDHPKVKIIYITAYTDTQTIQEATSTAPAFFLSKPFDAKDIEIALSMVAASICTVSQSALAHQPIIYTVCTETGAILRNGVCLNISPMERRIVATLMKAPRFVVSYEALSDAVWSDPQQISHGSLRNAVMRLRKKLTDVDIETVKEVGYALKFSDTVVIQR